MPVCWLVVTVTTRMGVMKDEQNEKILFPQKIDEFPSSLETDRWTLPLETHNISCMIRWHTVFTCTRACSLWYVLIWRGVRDILPRVADVYGTTAAVQPVVGSGKNKARREYLHLGSLWQPQSTAVLLTNVIVGGGGGYCHRKESFEKIREITFSDQVTWLQRHPSPRTSVPFTVHVLPTSQLRTRPPHNHIRVRGEEEALLRPWQTERC